MFELGFQILKSILYFKIKQKLLDLTKNYGLEEGLGYRMKSKKYQLETH